MVAKPTCTASCTTSKLFDLIKKNFNVVVDDLIMSIVHLQHEFCGCAVRRPSLNKLFHFGDRTTIYFFIAGSYSPFLMLQEIHPDLQWMQ